uniref:NF-kappa-B inhibitor-interacting Ras-like protein n=1 Tax=Glossina brevipalpis TaxID=37001 RepID=A0A1A9X4A7_9MUSC
MLTNKISKVGKVLICGMKGVGKTALLEQLIYGNVNVETEFHPTIEDIYVASVDGGRGTREILRLYDSAGLQGKAQLSRHYIHFPDGFVLIYDPTDPSSLDILADIKQDIDRNKEKKDVPVIVLANMRSKRREAPPSLQQTQQTNSTNPANQIEIILNRAISWCSRERIKHYTVNAMERPSLYDPFINLCARLHPPPTKSTFPQLRQVMQKTQKSDV